MASRGDRAKARGFGLEEIGQTNSAVIGPNFMMAMFKADAEKASTGPQHLKELAKLGFPKCAELIAPLSCGVKDADAKRQELWSKAAYLYTLEDSPDLGPDGKAKCLYREMNRAMRNDDESLMLWASYIACLFFGGCGQYTASLTPPKMLPAKNQTTYRGFAMDRSLAAKYKRGDEFFWQSFVSTSKQRETSLKFAIDNTAAGQTPFLFTIEVPPYAERGGKACWVYELEDVSAFKGEGEEEVLLLPYSQFKVLEDASEVDGAVHIHIELFHQPLVKQLVTITVWVDQSGFESGSNRELAKHAFHTGKPHFRRQEFPTVLERDWGTFEDYRTLPGAMKGLALFTDPASALDWIKGELVKTPSIHFKLLVSGSQSEAFLKGYQKVAGKTPCEAMVFCGNLDKWKSFWEKSPRVQVKNDVASVKEFLTHTKYDKMDYNDFVTLDKYASETSPDQRIWYPWKRVENGVVYGGAGDASIYANPKNKNNFTQASYCLPDVPMQPFEN